MDYTKVHNNFGDMQAGRFSQRGVVINVDIDRQLIQQQFDITLKNYLKRKEDHEKENAPILED